MICIASRIQQSLIILKQTICILFVSFEFWYRSAENYNTRLMESMTADRRLSVVKGSLAGSFNHMQISTELR